MIKSFPALNSLVKCEILKKLVSIVFTSLFQFGLKGEADDVDDFNAEGRLITAEFEKFFLVTTYVPNAGAKLITLPKRMKWDPMFR